MGKAKFQIERRCEVCGNPFFAKTLESRYCSEKCGQVAYTRRKREAKKLKKLQELTEQIDDDRDYITVPEAVAMYSVSRTSLYQYIHDGRIPSINLGVRLIRVSRKELEKYFPSAILQYVVKQPLELLGVEGKYDIKVNLDGGGYTGQSQALRLAIARALVKINADDKKTLKDKGFLTRDSRAVERKKPGRPKARRRFQFSKR